MSTLDEMTEEMFKKILPDKEFEENFDKICKLAIDKPTGVMPTLFVFTKSAIEFTNHTSKVTPCVFADMPEDFALRRKLMGAIGKKFALIAKDNGYPFQIVFISEAWVKKIRKEDYEKSNLRPKDYDDKTEELIVMGLSANKQQALARYEIVRGDDSKIKEYKELQKTLKPKDSERSDAYILYPFWQEFAQNI